MGDKKSKKDKAKTQKQTGAKQAKAEKQKQDKQQGRMSLSIVHGTTTEPRNLL